MFPEMVTADDHSGLLYARTERRLCVRAGYMTHRQKFGRVVWSWSGTPHGRSAASSCSTGSVPMLLVSSRHQSALTGSGLMQVLYIESLAPVDHVCGARDHQLLARCSTPMRSVCSTAGPVDGVRCAEMRLGLVGAHQRDNAVTAASAALALRQQGFENVGLPAILAGLSQACLPGRFQARSFGRPPLRRCSAQRHV